MNMPYARYLAICLVLLAPRVYAEQELPCNAVAEAPVIDGQLNDAAWSSVTAITTRDVVAGIEHQLRCVVHGERLYVSVQFPDADENREHKTLIWDAERKGYRIGPQREDTFVIKWNMEPLPVDLSLSADEPYTADIWFWKSVRTDPVGFADDKVQTYTRQPARKARKLLSRSAQTFYLSRRGDAGRAAYANRDVTDFVGDAVDGYDVAPPSGSRSDVRARGQWHDGRWTIEFARDFVTGHPDDVQFELGGRYQFGVSRFEVAGRKVEPALQIPQYGAGEVGEHLTLVVGASRSASR